MRAVGSTPAWRVVRAGGPAGELAARPDPSPPGRTASFLTPTTPALVLGSTQRAEVVDAAGAARAGVDVVHRPSGGGAVLVRPGELLWVELFVPREDGLWTDDVGRAFGWVGSAWSSALRALGVGAARAHAGPLQASRWSGLVCFAGIGPGEVLVGGRKVVGVSQRRTRAGARFFCAALRAWDADALVALLALTNEERSQAVQELRGVAAGIDVEPDALADALVDQLPHVGLR